MSGLLSLYPPLDPVSSMQLDVTGGHVLHVEIGGAPDGIPVLFVHGGPGSSINSNHRRFFDPAFYRIVLFDQRGCGKSAPMGETSNNTTQDLIDDIERLRIELRVERWILFGGSWGSTLALVYAQRHPERVRAMVLRGVFLASRAELAWFLEGLRAFMPEAWLRFSGGDERASAVSLLARYHAEVFGADARAALTAADRWNAYEGAVMAVGESAPAPMSGTPVAGASPSGALARVRVQLHYLVHGCFLDAEALLEGVSSLPPMPVIIVQGRRDLVCPPVTAHALHRRWPGSSLCMVEQGGHSAMHPAMVDALVQAMHTIRLSIEGGSR